MKGGAPLTMHSAEFLKERIATGETVTIGNAAFTTANLPDFDKAYEDAQKGTPPTAPFPPVENADLTAFKARNDAQADLIDALTKDPEDLKRLDKAGLLAVAKFEGVDGVDGRTSAEKLHEAILAKRGA